MYECEGDGKPVCEKVFLNERCPPSRYKLSGLSLADACEYNSTVARDLARPQIALTWVSTVQYIADGKCLISPIFEKVIRATPLPPFWLFRAPSIFAILGTGTVFASENFNNRLN